MNYYKLKKETNLVAILSLKAYSIVVLSTGSSLNKNPYNNKVHPPQINRKLTRCTVIVLKLYHSLTEITQQEVKFVDIINSATQFNRTIFFQLM